MNIALYYPWVYLTSGAERTILELTGRSRHAWTVFTNRYEPANTFPGFADRHVVQLGKVSVNRSISHVIRGGVRILSQRLPLEGMDALVVVCEGLGSFVNFRAGNLPILCLCLTPLRVVYDAHYRARHLAEKNGVHRAALAAVSAAYKVVDRMAWKRYDHVYCISEEVRGRVIQGRLVPAEKVEIAHVGLGFMPEQPSGKQDSYFLLPGRIMWTKNIELGIESFKRFREEHPEFSHFRLVIAGIVDEKSKPYQARLEALAGRDTNISFRIHPSDQELHDLYDQCYGVLFTAFNEDWGIVPLEGMAFGKPVIATDRGGPRESVQDGIQGYLAPPDVKAFADRMADLASAPERCRRMGQAGRERAKLFTWDRLTQTIDDKLEELVQTRGQDKRFTTN